MAAMAIRDIQDELMHVRVSMIGLTRKEAKGHNRYMQVLSGMIKKLRGDTPGLPDERAVEETEKALEEIHKERKKNRVKRGTMLITRRGDVGLKKRTTDNPSS